MNTLSQLPPRLIVFVCLGVLLSALVPANGQLDIVVSIMTLVLIIMLLREDVDKDMRSWLMLATGTYSIGVLADILDEVPELDSHWLINSIDNIFMHIGVFLICFCFIKMMTSRRSLINELNNQIDIAHQLEAELSRLVLEDDLTGLQNRRALFRHFDEIAFSHERGVLAYIDIDNFKQVNDTFSHACGDTLLVQIAQHLRDTAPAGSQIYRIGGDEFVLLFPSEDTENSQAWLSALYDASEATRDYYQIDLSVGLSPYYPGNLSDPDAILVKADKAMYKEKMAKKDEN